MKSPDIQSKFNIYSASAGSGKTFLLVQKYLETLLGSSSIYVFHRMLALTFTNKAVFEMKWRILEKLHAFSTKDIQHLEKDVMAQLLLESLGITYEELGHRSRRFLKAILHDYAAFDVITLDSFTHRLIRSFSKDLGLSYNFDVELQVDQMLRETVDDLLAMVGNDKEVTEALKNFTFYKMDDTGTSWDLKEGLYQAAKLILNENDQLGFQQIAVLNKKQKSERLKFLSDQHQQLTKSLIDLGERGLSLCHKNDLTKKDFSYGTLYNRFYNLSKKQFKDFDKGTFFDKLQKGTGIYLKSIPGEKQQKIETLLPEFQLCYTQAMETYYGLMLVEDIRKQWVPLTLLGQLVKRLEERQKEENKILLSTFNTRIQKEILKHQAPFIYERLGENYRHYFLDEFQDTSRLQWKNLIPLIENALVSEDISGKTGDLLLVGDPKQSIYRWRGGDVDQFTGLLGKDRPFPIHQKVISLSTNYRSSKTIVAFNNQLYSSLDSYLIYPENKTIFGAKAQQLIGKKSEGYVHIDFLPDMEESKQPDYPTELTRKIKNCFAQGYAFEEMAVLVRKRKQAQEITTHLSEKGIPFVSSDTLLLSSSKAVSFLVTLLYLHSEPTQKHQKKAHLDFLFTTKKRSITRHDYLAENLVRPIEKVWEAEGIKFQLDTFDQQSLYGCIEAACFVFPLIRGDDPFVQNFLDHIFNFCQKEHSSVPQLIDFWEKEVQFKPLGTAESTLGIRVLTIHQAKGLEFPIVFLPYADELIHPSIRKRIWLDTSSIYGEKFPLAWINFSSKVEHYGGYGKTIYDQTLREEEIDAWNTFYVATTRPVDALYIFTKRKETKKESYANFLQKFSTDQGFEIEEGSISWGNLPVKKRDSKDEKELEDKITFHHRYPFEKKLIVSEGKEINSNKARTFGLLFHALISEVNTSNEVDDRMHNAYLQGRITAEQKSIFTELCKKLVEDPRLAPYYSTAFTVMNEQQIFVNKECILRPDRLVYNEREAVVIDYKTGVKESSHIDQIKSYCSAIQEILERPTHGKIVYLPKSKGENIEITIVKAT